MEKKRKEFVRQVKFGTDCEITSVPVKDSERPQLEKQSDLFQFEKDQRNLKALENDCRK
jgi:hypothetical protein